MLDRRMRRLAERGETECGLRVVGGEHRGLSSHWRHGLARVDSHHISLCRYTWPGIRVPVPFVEPIEVHVTSVRPSTRTVGGREIWSVDPDAVLITVESPGALLEWALVRSAVDWALGRVT